MCEQRKWLAECVMVQLNDLYYVLEFFFLKKNYVNELIGKKLYKSQIPEVGERKGHHLERWSLFLELTML